MVGYTSDKEKKLSHLDYVIAGAGSGFITRMLCQPLDVLKIRFQLQVEPIAETKFSKYQSVYHAAKLIVKEEGLKSLWKGHIPAQLLSITYGVAQFWTFEVLTKELANIPEKFSPVVHFTCGSISGCTATLVSFPFDVVRTRLVAQSEQHKVYLGSRNAIKSMLKNEGFLCLYKGILPTFIQIGPHAGVQFMCYKLFDAFLKYLTDSKDTSLVRSLISGSFAGLCAKTAIYPFDLAKKRMQIQGFEEGRIIFGELFKCNGLTDCIIKIYKKEGPTGLFKGLSPSLVKAISTTALHFSTYEMICEMLQKEKEIFK